MIYGFVALCLIGSALSRQLPAGDHCPNVEAMKDFDIFKYLGRWYVAERFIESFQDSTVKCMMADYSLNENGIIKIVNTFQENGKSNSGEEIVCIPDPSELAKLTVDVVSGSCNDSTSEIYHWILGTDYDSFAVVYGCRNFKWAKFEYAFILTRDQNPSIDVIAKADEIIQMNNIVRSRFLKTNNAECELSLWNDY